MKESIIYTIPHLYRDDFRVRAYTFGEGENSLCIAGSMRGNEYQQMYMSGRVIQRLKNIEASGRWIDGHQVLVIPSMNPSSMNIGKRFWSIDNTDINRMFPGYNQGETTQRIADALFQTVNKYRNGVQFTSFYTPGEYQPHVRMMRTGYENVEKARDFGLPYIVVRNPRPYDTTTLNYNWQIWETDAFSLYSSTTAHIDPIGAERVVDGIERFMILQGIIRGEVQDCLQSRVCAYEQLINVRATQSGIYMSRVPHNSHVTEGQLLGEIVDTCTGDVLEKLISPVNGTLFFQYDEPILNAYSAALKILADDKT